MNSILQFIEREIEARLKNYYLQIKPIVIKVPKTILTIFFLIVIFSSFKNTDYAKAWAAMGTISAVIWALYHQEIKFYIERPILQIKGFEFEPPYFREAPQIATTGERAGEIVSIGFYINIPLENIGKRSAKNCQPILTGIAAIHNGKWIINQNWLSLPLKWVFDEFVIGEGRTLIPNRQYFFNLGCISTQHPEKFRILPTIEPTAQMHILDVGHYCFEIKVTCEEINPIIKYFYLKWDGPCSSKFDEVKQRINGHLEDSPPW